MEFDFPISIIPSDKILSLKNCFSSNYCSTLSKDFLIINDINSAIFILHY